MKLQEIALDKIIPGDRYRRDLGNIEELAANIIEQDENGVPRGIIVPLIVNSKMELQAGGRRYAAAKLLGLKKVPVVIRPTEGELDTRMIELIENVMRKEMHWTERVLLEKRIFDLRKEQDPNWTLTDQAKETDDVKSAVHRRIKLAEALVELPELAESENEFQAWKALKGAEESVLREVAIEKASKQNIGGVAKWAKDHYQIGNALEGMAKVNDGVLDFCEVDPPYGISYDEYTANRGGGQTAKNYTETDDYVPLLTAMAKQCYRTLKPNAFAIFWHASKRAPETLKVLESAGFSVNHVPAIWVRGGAGGRVDQPDVSFAPAYEPFYVVRKGLPKLAKSGRGNVFDFAGVPPQQRSHPTEKPLDLMLELLRCFVIPGARICVPFLGSGVTLRACYRLHVTGFGWDLDESYRNRFLATVIEEQKAGEYGEQKA